VTVLVETLNFGDDGGPEVDAASRLRLTSA
jgi:hypothetical protein